MDIELLIQVAAGLAAGALGKSAGRKKEESGGDLLQKVLAPLAAAAGATVAATGTAAVATGGLDGLPMDLIIREGGTTGMIAVVAHTIIKNQLELVRQIRFHKEAARQ